jgi:hypothetical protein
LRFALLAGACLLATGFALWNDRHVASDRLPEFLAAIIGLCGLTWGELLERSLFFKASVAFRMPGGPSA